MKASLDTQVFETIGEYRAWRTALPGSRGDSALLGLVPTMGALHAGHISLMEQAASACERVVVSIFVNPLQFGPNEDFDRYPRQFAQDLDKCRKAGVHAVFHPSVPEFYGHQAEQTTRVVPPASLISSLCGAFRPGHFEGVATVVMKLFGVVEPSRAYFGEKDYQQLTVIRRMVKDLNFPTTVIGVPTFRESDGLAMSSRNVYLSAAERQLAPALYRAICQVRDQSLADGKPLKEALELAKRDLLNIANFDLQYIDACDPDTLESLPEARRPMVVLVAGKLGDVRLIDNVVCR